MHETGKAIKLSVGYFLPSRIISSFELIRWKESAYENGRYPIIPRTIILVKKSIDRMRFPLFRRTRCVSKVRKIANNLHIARILTGATILENIKILGTHKLVSPLLSFRCLLNAIKMIKFARDFF